VIAETSSAHSLHTVWPLSLDNALRLASAGFAKAVITSDSAQTAKTLGSRKIGITPYLRNNFRLDIKDAAKDAAQLSIQRTIGGVLHEAS
jgi:ABC-type sugar transport system substrate-binding protein